MRSLQARMQAWVRESGVPVGRFAALAAAHAGQANHAAQRGARSAVDRAGRTWSSVSRNNRPLHVAGPRGSRRGAGVSTMIGTFARWLLTSRRAPCATCAPLDHDRLPACRRRQQRDPLQRQRRFQRAAELPDLRRTPIGRTGARSSSAPTRSRSALKRLSMRATPVRITTAPGEPPAMNTQPWHSYTPMPLPEPTASPAPPAEPSGIPVSRSVRIAELSPTRSAGCGRGS